MEKTELSEKYSYYIISLAQALLLLPIYSARKKWAGFVGEQNKKGRYLP